RKTPQQAYLHNLLGEVQGQQQKFDLALVSLKKASELDPRWSIPYMNRANMLAATGKMDDATAVLEEGLKNAPTSQLLQFAVALMYQRTEKIDLAIDAYERILKERPATPAAVNNLAVLLADYRQ